MIRVGQVYEFKEKSEIDIVVVTKEYPPTKDFNFYRYDLIFQDGELNECDWEIIGNIHENADLIKVGGK